VFHQPGHPHTWAPAVGHPSRRGEGETQAVSERRGSLFSLIQHGIDKPLNRSRLLHIRTVPAGMIIAIRRPLDASVGELKV